MTEIGTAEVLLNKSPPREKEGQAAGVTEKMKQRAIGTNNVDYVVISVNRGKADGHLEMDRHNR